MLKRLRPNPLLHATSSTTLTTSIPRSSYKQSVNYLNVARRKIRLGIALWSRRWNKAGLSELHVELVSFIPVTMRAAWCLQVELSQNIFLTFMYCRTRTIRFA